MIAAISGTILSKHNDSLIIDVAGVGYRVYVGMDLLTSTETGSTISLHTHLAVRETALDLYGFSEYQELGFFELLIGISGIGPKSALAILSLAPVSTLRQAILKGDDSYLTKVSGIGKKNAQKIIIELRDKIDDIADETGAVAVSEDVETLEALKALGYTEREAREALRAVPHEITDQQKRLKAALKQLA